MISKYCELKQFFRHDKQQWQPAIFHRAKNPSNIFQSVYDKILLLPEKNREREFPRNRNEYTNIAIEEDWHNFLFQNFYGFSSVAQNHWQFLCQDNSTPASWPTPTSYPLVNRSSRATFSYCTKQVEWYNDFPSFLQTKWKLHLKAEVSIICRDIAAICLSAYSNRKVKPTVFSAPFHPELSSSKESPSVRSFSVPDFSPDSIKVHFCLFPISPKDVIFSQFPDATER